MKYFSRFPITVVTTNGKSTIITDFLRRVAISNKFRENTVAMEDYFVLDGETPEMVSNKLYATPANHWLILMVNDITNPREEWPIPDSKVTDLVYQKYDFVLTVPSGAAYSVNNIITSDGDGTFIVTKKNGNTVYLRSQVGKTILTTSSILTNTSTEVGNLTITAVTDPEEDVHHYYDDGIGHIVDAGYSASTNPVTNYEYEVDVNDSKRTIKVVSPVFVPTIISEFDNLISGT